MNLSQAISITMVLLEGSYGQRFKVTDATIPAWATLLSDVEPDELVEIVKGICQSKREWPPTPGDILNIAKPYCTCSYCGACIRRRRLGLKAKQPSAIPPHLLSMLEGRPGQQLLGGGDEVR